MQTLTPTQASSRLSELIDAAVGGEEIVVAKDGIAVRLVPIPSALAVGSSKPVDWSDVLEEFAGKAEGLPADMARNHDHYLHGAPLK